MFTRLILSMLLSVTLVLPAAADSVRLDQLFQALKLAQDDEWNVIEDEIWQLWSESGSPSIDLLLERGMAAMADDDPNAAIEHFTALIDHAPNFAEGWNARATAYFAADLYGPSLSDIRRTLELEPRHFGALSGLGLILEETGHLTDALRAYRKVQDIHPHRPDVSEAIQRVELALGVYDA